MRNRSILLGSMKRNRPIKKPFSFKKILNQPLKMLRKMENEKEQEKGKGNGKFWFLPTFSFLGVKQKEMETDSLFSAPFFFLLCFFVVRGDQNPGKTWFFSLDSTHCRIRFCEFLPFPRAFPLIVYCLLSTRFALSFVPSPSIHWIPPPLQLGGERLFVHV